jgi:penicillin-binding protein 1C
MIDFNLPKIQIDKKITFVVIFFLLFFLLLMASYQAQKTMLSLYNSYASEIIKDRYGKIIYIKPNQKGYYAYYIDKIPARVKELLIQKEDKYFYYHLGLNPKSTFEAIFARLGLGKRRASSTITQQLVKILLGKELERNIKNKMVELFYTLSLEIYQPKEKILAMYVNSIYFGNRAQGIFEASQMYFGLPPDLLTDSQILQLLATISSPSKNNPLKSKNQEIARGLAKRLKIKEENLVFLEPQKIKENIRKHNHFDDLSFEVTSLLEDHPKNCQLTLDKGLNKKIREIVQRNIEKLKSKNAKNGAVVVIKLPEAQLLALVGSPNPKSFEEGYQINMLTRPRAIGSTIKPFIYLRAFEKGLRPYTLVDDREYKYITAIGLPLYPKNFDYQYRGIVTLHYALANSLNVPALKVLEYIGLEDFYQFLEKDLEFRAPQKLENYQLGIALGALEMSLLDLARYFTIFPNEGLLKPLKISEDKNCDFHLALAKKKIAKEKYVELINKILSDRKTGIEEFGLKSELNLFQKNYALKTGTSRDFKDSWIIGYTPDFLVGVWVGNADLSPTQKLSGQIGAGQIWSEVMELLFNSQYNKKTPFSFNFIKEFREDDNLEYGLAEDNYSEIKNILLQDENKSVILNPHQGDRFLLEEKTKIILEAKEKVSWFVNGKLFEKARKSIFSPQKSGKYKIMARLPDGRQEEVEIFVAQ